MKLCKLILIIMTFAGWSCQKQMDPVVPIVPEAPIDPEIPIDVEPRTLNGTHWKLVGIMEGETNTLKVLEPDSKNRYIICLDTQYGDIFMVNPSINACYYSSANELYGRFDANYTTQEISFVIYEETKVAETGDGDLWLQIFPAVESFFLERNELRLYYNNSKNYMLFTRGSYDVSDLQANRSENLWDQPLHKIQECLHGKWKVLRVTHWGLPGNYYPANNIVSIDTLNSTVVITTNENDPWSYMNGQNRPYCSFSYNWEIKDVYRGIMGPTQPPNFTTYVMQNEDHEIEGWYFDYIIKIVDDTLLNVVVDYQEKPTYRYYTFLKIKENKP